MTASCAIGTHGKFAVKQGSSSYTWSTGTVYQAPFYHENVKKRGTIGNPNVITGSRSSNSERNRKGPNFHGGSILFPVDPGNLVWLLEAALGTAPSGTTFAVAETLTNYGYLIDKVTGTFELQNAVVDKLLITGQQTGPGGAPNYLKAMVSLIGTGSQGGVSFPTASIPLTNQYIPYVFEDGVITLQSATRNIKRFALLIDNHVHARYVNSLDPTILCPTNRTVVLSTVHPYDADEDDLYDQALAGAAGTLAFTNGAVSTSFAFANLAVPANTPVITGKTEIDLELTMQARMSSTTREIIVTNDSTP